MPWAMTASYVNNSLPEKMRMLYKTANLGLDRDDSFFYNTNESSLRPRVLLKAEVNL
jgi:hypothetical protein